jgi:hypothetical protein
MALGSTQPLLEMSTRNVPLSKGRPARKADNLPAICERLSRKCGSTDVSQPYGPPRPVAGIALHLLYMKIFNQARASRTQKLVSRGLLTCVHLTEKTRFVGGHFHNFFRFQFPFLEIIKVLLPRTISDLLLSQCIASKS